jgi:cytoskeleton protein RodZ
MPPSLGQRLKHAREKRGLDLRDVQHTTRIPVARLQDLEEDKLNTFGGMTYAKSFLRTYANLLEVDAEDILSQIKPPPLGGARDYRYLVESQGPWIVDRGDRQSPMTSAPPLTPGKSFLFAGLVCLAFGLLIGGAVLANAYFSSKTTASGTVDPGAATSTSTGTASTATTNASSAAGEQDYTVQRAITPSPAENNTQPPPAIPITPPKAVPVTEPPPHSGRKPPKAEPVR